MILARRLSKERPNDGVNTDMNHVKNTSHFFDIWSYRNTSSFALHQVYSITNTIFKFRIVSTQQTFVIFVSCLPVLIKSLLHFHNFADFTERLLPWLGAHRHGWSQSPQVSRWGRCHSCLLGTASRRSHWASREVCLWQRSPAVVKRSLGHDRIEFCLLRQQKSNLPKVSTLTFKISFGFLFSLLTSW